MKKLILLLISLGLAAFADANLQIIEDSSSYKYIKISKNDTNRMYCENGNFGNIIYSQNKEITVTPVNKNAYIKLKEIITTRNDAIIERKVNSFDREIYIECDGVVFSLYLVPTKDLRAQTIVFKSKKEKKDNQNAKVYEKEKSSDYDTITNNLIKYVFNNSTPTGYEISFIGKKIADFQELSLYHSKSYNGHKYVVHEYIINAKEPLILSEKMFIKFVENPLKISLSKLDIKKEEAIKMIVISNNNPSKITYDKKMVNFINSKTELEKKEPAKELPKLQTKQVKKEVGQKTSRSKEIIDKYLKQYGK